MLVDKKPYFNGKPLDSPDGEVLFREFYQKYHQKVFAFLYHYLPNREHCKDLLQEIFIKIWQKGYHEKRDWDAEGFLFKTCKNKVIDQVRKQTSEDKLKNGYQRRRTERSNSTENKVIFDEYQELAAAAISALPPKRRQVFLLSREHGLSYKEIADVLEIAPGTVMSRIYRGKQILKELMNNWKQGKVPGMQAEVL